MNRDNDFLTTSVHDRAAPEWDALPPRSWRWVFIGQLWILAALVGLSLFVTAVASAFHGGAGHAADVLLSMGLVGALLALVAWRGLERTLQRM